MRKTFIYLLFIVVGSGLYSCTTHNNSLSVTPVLNNNPTPVYNAYNVSGYYRVYNNGAMLNFPVLATSVNNDTERVFQGLLAANDSIPLISIHLYNYDSFKVGNYAFTPGVNILAMGLIDTMAAYTNPTIMANMLAANWNMSILIKTPNRFKCAFNFVRVDGKVFTNGMLDVSW
jgi:hypothetical protein